MDELFSRKEISGWGDPNVNYGKQFEIGIVSEHILEELSEEYSSKLYVLIDRILEGLHLTEVSVKTLNNVIPQMLREIILIRALKKFTFLISQNNNLVDEEFYYQKQTEIAKDIVSYIVFKYDKNLFESFDYKLNRLVQNYLRKLPGFIKSSDQDDLMNIARLEFLQTLRLWDPVENSVVWPFAYSRVNGAMRDHIRFLTKADPTRVYNWVSDAAYMYLSINKNQNEFSGKVEDRVTLLHALESLNDLEKKVVKLKSMDDLTLVEIGKRVSLSESQVSRIYRNAVEKLKKILTK